MDWLHKGGSVAEALEKHPAPWKVDRVWPWRAWDATGREVVFVNYGPSLTRDAINTTALLVAAVNAFSAGDDK